MPSLVVRTVIYSDGREIGVGQVDAPGARMVAESVRKAGHDAMYLAAAEMGIRASDFDAPPPVRTVPVIHDRPVERGKTESE